ncbi:DNA topoisomerase 2 isoform X1 [Carica papaya]|uniref:DNA topoisomerase 2 isoform X1 n=1 Tax=Carica papaya TaxID=3649 RepID=UPI000B8D1B41|nr:DNA topoisomerase 2 isoform X1 [Carica papaya]
MHPWYRGFKGTIEKSATKEGGVTYTVTGIIEEVDETTLRIRELPIRRWTDDFREYLRSLKTDSGPFIQNIKEYSDDTTVDFELIMSEGNMMAAKQEGLLKKFKLTTTISTSNMHLFDPKGVIKKYDTPEQILEDFFHLRLEFYEKRKKVLLENLEMELLKLENKVRFILAVVSGDIIVSNRKKADLFLELERKGFTPYPKRCKSVEAVVAGASRDTEEAEENEEPAGYSVVPDTDYDYLLSLAIGTLTLEKVQELCACRDKMNEEVEELRRATPKTLWVKDLDALEKELDNLDKGDAQAEEARKEMQNKLRNGSGKKIRKQAAAKKPRKDNKKINDVEIAENVGIAGTAMKTDKVPEVVKPRGRAGSKKPPPAPEKEEGEEEEMLDLAQRLARYNFSSSSSSDRSISIEPEVTQQTEDDIEVAAPAAAGKKGGRKPAANKSKAAAAKPPAPARKRGPATKKSQGLGQKLVTEMLKPAENPGVSPEKKMRKMRASPFNKKSGSVLSEVSSEQETSESGELQGSASSLNSEASEMVIPARPRPQRGNRTRVKYVVSDSESEKASDDSDFDVIDVDEDD